MRPKVVAFMEKVEFKMYPKSVWNFIKEQQIEVWKLCKQQGTKPMMKQTSADARIATLEAKLGKLLNLRRVISRKRKDRHPKNQKGEGTGEILL